MKTITMFAAGVLAHGLMVVPALAANASSPVGTWQITSGESRYEVEMCGDGTALCATLVWLRDDVRPPKTSLTSTRWSSWKRNRPGP